MKIEEFYRKFANMPLGKRIIYFRFRKHGLKTFLDLYKEIHDLDEKMRPMRIQIDELLRTAEKFLKLLE